MENLWKLRRLAPRALRVLERHKALDAAIAAYEHTLQPAAAAYMDTYDRLRTMNVTQAHELDQGKRAIAALANKLSSWSAQIAATGVIKGFKRTEYADTPDVPDDVMSDAESFMAVVTEQVALDPESLPYADSLIADVNATLELAKAEWKEASDVRSAWMMLVDENRNNAREFANALVGFRQTLLRTIGRKHPDYQSLRSNKIDRAVLEDGEANDLPEELVPESQVDTEVPGAQKEDDGELDPTG